MRAVLATFIFLLWTGLAHAGCKLQPFRGASYTVCIFDTKQDRIALYNLDPAGQPYGGFGPLRQELATRGQDLAFGMNAGMFDAELKPVGLYVEGGRTLHKINRRNGAGNFHLKPNGVFYVAGGRAGVMETETFLRSGIKPDYATQSGPMLVLNGTIHPKLSPSGTSAKIRNGVGMVDDQTIVFVISNDLVTFHDFAALFLEELKCRNALFLDGSVSSLYAPEVGRSDFLARLGPMVAVTTTH
jgi:prepilin-type processing-associated H-X9-DG protein